MPILRNIGWGICGISFLSTRSFLSRSEQRHATEEVRRESVTRTGDETGRPASRFENTVTQPDSWADQDVAWDAFLA